MIMAVFNGHIVVAEFDRLEYALNFHTSLLWHHKDLNPTLFTNRVTVTCPNRSVFDVVKDKALGMGAITT
jgi:hypothetical protein